MEPKAMVDRIAALGRPLLLALDVDGTLAPIRDDPEAVHIDDATRALLARLSAVANVHVALVTGRDAASLDLVAGKMPVWRAVSHGRRVIPPGGDPAPQRLSPRSSSRLAAFDAWVRREAVPRGARLETKEGAVAVHVRELARKDPSSADALLLEARGRAEQEGLHARLGRAVLEAEVEVGDKGAALERLLDATGATGVVYAGDDLTDEPAITLAVARGGVGIFVRSGERTAPDSASGSVDGPAGLAALLHAVADTLAANAEN